jgi:structural maintenance of chromosome 3 (chondroitin sulfate proteoglycan 6)
LCIYYLENKREKIDSLLKYIEDRLQTLESEKEELKEYQKWDKMKRAVEYTMYEQEQRDNRSKELRLQQQREEVNVKKDELIARQTDVTEKLHVRLFVFQFLIACLLVLAD